MDIKKIVSNFSVALIAQSVNLLASFAIALFVPKVLGVEEYGYWQLFIFYGSYVGLFHLGLNDGIYLILGGQARASVNKPYIKGQFIIGCGLQVFFAFVIILLAIFGDFGNQREFVLFSTAYLLIVTNLASFLGYVFQAMNETKLYSFSILLNGLAFLFPLAFLLLFQVNSFQIYVVTYLFAKTLSLLFCIWKGRDILQAPTDKISTGFRNSITSVRVGIKLTLANHLNAFIVGAVQLLVDYSWGIEVFSIVSLALSMVTFFMVFISQASMVLFPALRQATVCEQVSFFENIRDALGLFLPGVYIFYLPISLILTMWLPQYSLSFQLFALLLPLCVYDGKMDIVGVTYLKVLRGESSLLLINAITAGLSFIVAAIGVFYFNSLEVTIALVMVVVIGRCMFAECYIGKKIKAKNSVIGIESIIVSIVFVLTSVCLESLLAFAVYFAVYVAFLLVNRKALVKIFRTVINF